MGSFELFPLPPLSLLKSGNISNSNLHIFLIIHFLLPSCPALFFLLRNIIGTAHCNLKLHHTENSEDVWDADDDQKWSRGGGPFLSECLRLELSLSLRCRPHYQSVVF